MKKNVYNNVQDLIISFASGFLDRFSKVRFESFEEIGKKLGVDVSGEYEIEDVIKLEVRLYLAVKTSPRKKIIQQSPAW